MLHCNNNPLWARACQSTADLTSHVIFLVWNYRVKSVAMQILMMPGWHDPIHWSKIPKLGMDKVVYPVVQVQTTML